MLLSLLLGPRARRRPVVATTHKERLTIAILGLVSLLVALGLGSAFVKLAGGLGLSQQCRMSRMWPAYVVSRPASPSGLGAKYSLFLYRERGPHGHPADRDDEVQGTPALFIPGNAGHYAQIRSVASSCASQYYQGTGHGVVRPEWKHAPGPVDWWTVHFNEDLSAFHGATMLGQATYVNEVVAHLLALYSAKGRNVSSVPVLAHSMGGIVARLMLEQPNYVAGSIDTILTLSTPHLFPPAPFDRTIEAIYKRINSAAQTYSRLLLDAGSDPVAQEAARRSFPRFADVLLISIGSGSLDTQITSESSTLALGSPTLPALWPAQQGITTFTSALPGLWSSVNHVSMAWCDQLRERIARASMMDAMLFSKAGARRGTQAVRARKELWERFLGANADWGIEDEPGQRLNSTLDFSMMGSGVSSPRGPLSDLVASFDLTRDNEEESLEVLTSLAVGDEPTLGLGVVTAPELEIRLCKGPIAQQDNDSASCRPVQAHQYELLPPSTFHPTLSQATQYSPSVLFPHAETRYELPGQGWRRWCASGRDLRAAGYWSVRVVRSRASSSSASPSAFVRAGWTSSTPVLVSPESISVAGGLLSTVKLEVADALRASTMRSKRGPGPGPALHFLVPSMDSSLLAYRLEIEMARCNASIVASSSQPAFSPMLVARHRGTGDAVWFPSLLEGGGTDEEPSAKPTAHTERLRMSLYGSSPFVPPASAAQQGTFFTLFFDPATASPNEDKQSKLTTADAATACNSLAAGGLERITIRVDWTLSLGLLAMRYRFVALVFPFAMLCLLVGWMWDEWNSGGMDTEAAAREGGKARAEDEDGVDLDNGSTQALEEAVFPPLLSSLWTLGPRVLLIMSIASALLALLQAGMVHLVGVPAANEQGMLNWLLGYPGPASFSLVVLAPMLLLASFSVLVVQTVVLVGLVRLLGAVGALLTRGRSAEGAAEWDADGVGQAGKKDKDVVAYSRTTLLALLGAALAVIFVVPYQLAYLVATMVQLTNVVRASVAARRLRTASRTSSSSLAGARGWDTARAKHDAAALRAAESRYNQQLVLFVLMFAVLPIRAPVLIVWGRNVLLGVRASGSTTTTMVAGWWGDHNVLEVAGFLLLVQVGSAGRVFLPAPSRLMARLTHLLFGIVAIKSLTWGLRYTYLLYDGLNVLVAWLLFVQWMARRARVAVDGRLEGHSYAPVRQSVDDVDHGDGLLPGPSTSVSHSTVQARHTGVKPLASLEGSSSFSSLEAGAVPAASIRSTPTSHMDVPSTLLRPGTNPLPPSLAASIDPSIAARRRLDVLLAAYLDTAAAYHAARTRAGSSFAKAYFELVRARMQVGGGVLGRDGWDARLVARVKVRTLVGSEEGGRVRRFEAQRVVPLPVDDAANSDEEEGGGEAEVQPYTIDEEPTPTAKTASTLTSALRRRKLPSSSPSQKAPALTEGGDKESADLDEDWDDKKKQGTSSTLSDADAAKEKQKDKDQRPKRPPQPPDPLYQFAALPPPALRAAKAHFESALEACIGPARIRDGSSRPAEEDGGPGGQSVEEKGRDDVLSLLLRLTELEHDIEDARKEVQVGPPR